MSAHQPELLPWLGYISKASLADVYFILDNVQYVKDVFQNRNKIRVKQGDGWCWLNIPVLKAKTHMMNWSEVRIDNSQKWVKKHLNTIYHSYSKTPYFQPLYENIEKDFITENGVASKETNLGQEEEKLALLNAKVLTSIEELADFCKSCKPPKKKK